MPFAGACARVPQDHTVGFGSWRMCTSNSAPPARPPRCHDGGRAGEDDVAETPRDGVGRAHDLQIVVAEEVSRIHAGAVEVVVGHRLAALVLRRHDDEVVVHPSIREPLAPRVIRAALEVVDEVPHHDVKVVGLGSEAPSDVVVESSVCRPGRTDARASRRPGSSCPRCRPQGPPVLVAVFRTPTRNARGAPSCRPCLPRCAASHRSLRAAPGSSGA